MRKKEEKYGRKFNQEMAKKKVQAKLGKVNGSPHPYIVKVHLRVVETVARKRGKYLLTYPQHGLYITPNFKLHPF